MNDEINKRRPGRPKKDDRTEEENNDLDMLFSDINQSYTVKVYRHDPEWCAGYVGSFHMGAGKCVSIEEIKNRFGGRRLELVTYDPTRGSIARKKTILIDDMPKREGEILKRDGTTEQASVQNSSTEPHPLEVISRLNLPPHIARQAMAYHLGTPEQPTDTKKPDTGSDMFQQQMMMDMMSQARQSQMTMMQQQFEMQKTMMGAMREMEDSKKPRDALGEVNNTISLMREINGIKTELGVGGNTSLASQVLETTVPLVEHALTEYLGYKRIQAQAQAQKNTQVQDLKPELPSRNATRQIPVGVEPTLSAVQQATEMAKMYKTLPPKEQTAVMNAFIGSLEGPNNIETPLEMGYNQNIATKLESDRIEDDDDILTDEDRILLNGHTNADEGRDIPNEQYPASIDNNDQIDRESYNPGIPVSSD